MTSTRTVLLPTHPHVRHPLTGDPLVALYVDRRGRPRWPMMGAAPDDPPPSDDPPKQDDPPKNDPPADVPPPSEKKFDQAEVDRLIGDRLAKEQKKFDEQLEQLKADAGKTEIEKLTAERDRYKEQADGASKAAAQRAAQAEAKLQANLLGGRTDRLATILKTADLDDVLTDEGDVDDAKVKAAVEKVLTEFPEWKRTAGKSGEELGGGGGEGKPTFTRQQIKDMTQEERERRADELADALADGRVTS